MLDNFLLGENGLFSGLPPALAAVLSKIITIVIVLIAAKLIICVLRAVIKRAFAHSIKKSDDAAYSRKKGTICQLTLGVMRFAVWFLACATILDSLSLGVTAGSLLATAGIGGLALGIGAQAFIADIVNGFMLMLENQYSVGDYIVVGTVEGTVKSVSLRTTSLCLPNGELAMIPNGQIKQVINYSRSNYILFFEYNISYNEDTERAAGIMLAAARAYAAKSENIAGDIEYVGPVRVEPKLIRLRITVPVKPLSHWQVDRDLRAAVAEAFAREGVSVPDYENCVVMGGGA